MFNLIKFFLRNWNKKIDRHIPCDLSFQTSYIDENLSFLKTIYDLFKIDGRQFLKIFILFKFIGQIKSDFWHFF